MNNNILIPFFICLISGLSTLIGYLFIYIKPNNINRFISICLSFSGSIMLIISIFELIPEGFFYLNTKYNLFIAVFSLILMLLVGFYINYLINRKIIKIKGKNGNLYRVGILSMLALMIHNLPEGILTFLSGSINIKLGIKYGLAIMLHNIPEGIAIAIPIYYGTNSKILAFKNTLISSLSEPLGALLAYLFLYKYLSNIMISYILLFVSGIMISISINDILTESIKSSKKYLYIGLILAVFFTILTNIFI